MQTDYQNSNKKTKARQFEKKLFNRYYMRETSSRSIDVGNEEKKIELNMKTHKKRRNISKQKQNLNFSIEKEKKTGCEWGNRMSELTYRITLSNQGETHISVKEKKKKKTIFDNHR